MADFSELKLSRNQKETKKSFLKETPQNSTARDASEKNQPQTQHESVVDLAKPPLGNVSDSPEQSSIATAQLDVRTDDGMYKLLPADLEVRQSASRGKGIWSRGPRRRGVILFSETPSIATLSTAYLSTHCSACFLDAGDTSLKRCPTCRLLHYCDAECQRRDWPRHKRECPALQKWTTAAPSAEASDAIRALGRILWEKQKKGHDNIWVREMDAMQSHRSSLSSSEEASQLHTHLAHALVRYLGLESPSDLATYGIGSAGSLVDFISRFTTNAFAVTSPTLTPIGVSISPCFALFNHSCNPNAVLVFPRPQHSPKKQQPLLQVIAIKDVMPDEEVVISYIDSTLPRDQRRRALKETYHFDCECSVCNTPRDGTYVDPREGMFCPKKCGGVCWLPTEENNFTRCTKCKAAVKDTDAIIDATRIGQEALDKATRIQFSDPQKAIQLTTNLIPILNSAGLLPSTHPLLALSRLQTNLLITNYRSPFDSNAIELNSPQIQEQHQLDPETKTTLAEAQKNLDEAIRSATRTCGGLDQILPYGHPIRALATAELGKLLSVDEPAPKHLIEESTALLSNNAASAATSSASARLADISIPYPPSGPQRLKLAYETLVRARVELMVGFGGGKNEGGQAGEEVRTALVSVEKELGVWKDGIRNTLADLPRAAVQK